jgi:flagellar motor protein MotB
MKRIRVGRKDGEAEGFVWITFSDLLTTLFMVFMVIALWAIANRENLKQEANMQKQKGEQCLKDLESAGVEQKNKIEALNSVSKKMMAEFTVLQKNGTCLEARIEEIREPGGFRIFQKDGYRPWFETGRANLSNDAQQCLSSIGEVWLSQINSNRYISASVQHILIEGHANSEPYPGLNEKQNFLRNLGLSQERAYEAAKFLIEHLDTNITTPKRKYMLREMLVAQGKSSLEPVFSDSDSSKEDLERSKRLEFKIVLGGKDAD